VTLKLFSLVASNQLNSVKAAVKDRRAAARINGLLTFDSAAQIPPSNPVNA
jgi:hypothetical protein